MVPNRKGFSLMELMFVLAIIAILAVVAIPAMGDIIDRYELKGAARDISSTLQLLRIRAIARNKNTYLDFTPGSVTLSDGFYTAFVDLDNGGDNDGATETKATNLNLNDVLGGYSGVLLPDGVSFGWGTWGTDVTKTACTGSSTTAPTDAVMFDNISGESAKFETSGANARMGTVYLANTSISKFYAISVAITGRIKFCRWDGGSWN